MSEYKLRDLQKLFPTWNIKTSYKHGDLRYNFNGIIVVRACVIDIHINNIKDIYNSNNYIEQFLLENDFTNNKNLLDNIYTKNGITIRLYENLYCPYYIDIIGGFSGPYYDSTSFIIKIKEILNINFHCKAVTYHE